MCFGVQNAISKDMLWEVSLDFYGVGDLFMIHNDYTMTSENLYFLSNILKALVLSMVKEIRV